MAVVRPYACPICLELFTKWGLCQEHLRSVLCSRALVESSGGESSDEEALRTLCRECASTGEPIPEEFTSVLQRLTQARKDRLMTRDEVSAIQLRYPEVLELTPPLQRAIVDRFLAPGLVDSRWIEDKIAWFGRCLEFGKRTSTGGDQGPSPAKSIVSALARHCFLPEVLSPDVCERYLALPEAVQSQVVTALHASLPTVERANFLTYFSNLCFNEECIHQHTNSPPEQLHPWPEQKTFQQLTWATYHVMMYKMLLLKRGCDEQVFALLAEAGRNVSKREESLFFIHAATVRARQNNNALNSLLHAAALNGHVRVCARLIAEGFGVNELAGTSRSAPLHVAASSGDVRVIKLLLEKNADVHLQDGDGHTALYCAVQAAVSPRVGAAAAADAAVMASSDANMAGSASNAGITYATSSAAGVAGPAPQTRLTHRSLQFDVCRVLLHAGSSVDPESSGENLARSNRLSDFQNLIRFHGKLRLLKARFQLDSLVIGELEKLQYETQVYVLESFDNEIAVDGQGGALELCALTMSEFIQKRDEVQGLANRLAHRLKLGKSDVDAIVSLPPAAGLRALETWYPKAKIKEPPAADAEISDEPAADAEPRPAGFSLQPQADAEASPAGFSLQPQEAAPSDSKTLRLGATVGGEQSSGTSEVQPGEVSLSDELMLHIQSKAVQDVAAEDDRQRQPWFRCVGFRERAGSLGPEDQAVWRQEIDLRIGVLTRKSTTPLVKEDFADNALLTFLRRFAARGRETVARVSEVLAMIEAATADKSRDDVPDWPAFLATFLRNLDPVLYESQDPDQDVGPPLAAASAVAGSMASASDTAAASSIAL